MNAVARTYVVEFAGTFAFVFLSAGAVCADAVPALSGHSGYGKIGIALTTAAAWAGTLAITVRASGGFLNPAITMMLWAFGALPHRRAIGYVVAQFLAAALAGLAIRALLFVNESALLETRLGTPHLNLAAFRATEVLRGTLILGIGIEAILTFILVIGVCILHLDPRFRQKAGEPVSRLVYLWLGMLLFAETMIAQQYTGVCLNPARWFGTVIWELTVPVLAAKKPFVDHAVYWIGPAIGSVLAGIVYFFFAAPEEMESK